VTQKFSESLTATIERCFMMKFCVQFSYIEVGPIAAYVRNLHCSWPLLCHVEVVTIVRRNDDNRLHLI
jgi:hypothetical protein